MDGMIAHKDKFYSACTVEEIQRVLALLPSDCLLYYEEYGCVHVATLTPLAAFPQIEPFRTDVEGIWYYGYALPSLWQVVQGKDPRI